MMRFIRDFKNVNGKSIYLEYGKSESRSQTIVFLHDSLGCTSLWRDFPLRLADAANCNFLVYDRLGYGKSDPLPTYNRPVNYMDLEADALIDLLTVLEIDDAVLFGHSDGGTIALLTAIKYPSRVKCVICEAAHIFVEELTLNGVYKAKNAYANTDLPARLEKYHGNKVETLFKAWTETWIRVDFRNWSIQKDLSAITCPLLFIQGESDEFGTLNQVDKTINSVSSYAEKFVIPNVGHTPHKETPDIVLEKATAFIFNQKF